jgi:hypothetical protein
MQELILGPVAIWFGVPALVGTAFFTLRMALMLVGGADTDVGFDVDVDVDFDVDMDLDVDAGNVDAVSETGGDPGDSTQAFKTLSIQAIASFVMGFGWGGLGAFSGGGWPLSISIAFAILCGLGMVWFLGKLLRFVYGFQSSGTVAMYQALESEGTVYAQIPAGSQGMGRVRVVIGDRARYYKAITDGDALPRDSKIRVVEINEDDNSVKVVEA